MNQQKSIRISLVVVGFCLAEGVSAQQPLSLLEAQDYAVKNGFSVISALADEEAARLTTEELIGIGLPQVNASLQYQNYINLPTSLVPAEFFGGEAGDFAAVQFGTPHNMTVGLSANQLLFDGSWIVGLQASRVYADLQHKQVHKSEIEIRNEVAGVYHLALIARKNVEMLEAGKTNLDNMLHDTQGLLEAGFAELQDVEQLQLSVNGFQNRIAYGKQQEQLTVDLLKFTIGMPVATEVILTDDAENLLLTATDALANEPFDLESNINVQVMTAGLGLQELSLRNQKAKLLPQMGAFYNLQTQAQRNEFSFLDTSEPWYPIQLWGVQLNVPIFSGMSKTRSIDKARVEVQRMTDMLEMTKESAQLEYRTALSEYTYAKSNFNSVKENLKLAGDILDRTNIKFKEGLSSSFDITLYNTQLLSTQGNYIQAMLDLLNAKSRLIKALNK